MSYTLQIIGGQNKDRLRTGLYLVSAFFILFFFYSTFNICTEMTEKELIEREETHYKNDFVTFEVQSLEQLSINDKNFLTYGQYIWKISQNLIQVIFLLVFMLMLYYGDDGKRVKK